MADNKIVHRVSLEGADKVAKQLDAIGDSGEKAFKRVKDAAEGGAGGALGGLGKTEESRAAAERLREVLHTLHPILDTAGLGLGNLGAFARVAGAGMGALAAAVVGSVLAGLEKIAEQSDRTGRRLKALSGSDSAFAALKDQAKELGLDANDLAPNFEKLLQYGRQLRADQAQAGGITHPPVRERPEGGLIPNSGFVPGEEDESASNVQIFNGRQAFPGGVPSDKKLAAFNQALFEGSRIDKTPKDQAIGGIGALLDSILKSGQVKSDDIANLQKISPAVAQEVAKALSGSSADGGLGRNFANPAELTAFLDKGGGKLSTQQLISAVTKSAPGIHERAEAVPPGITESFDHLEAAAKRVAEALSGDAGIAGAVDKFAKTIDGAADTIDKTLHPQDYQPGGSKFIGPVRTEDRHAAPKRLGEVFSSKQGDLLGRLVGYLRGGSTGQSGGNPFGDTSTFLTKAATDPGALQERPRPETGASPGPPLESAKDVRISPPAIGFDRTSDELLIKSAPEPQPVQPSPSTNGPRSEADHPTQLASLGPAAEEAATPRAVGLSDLPAAKPSLPASPAANPPEFEYIPPPSRDEQQRLERDRLQSPPLPSSQPPQPPQQPPNTPIQFGEAGQPQQVASLGAQLQSLIEAVSSALNGAGAKNVNQGGQPVGVLGVRGERQPPIDESNATSKIADLGAAAEGAAANLRGVEVPVAAAEPKTVTAAKGGVVHLAKGGEARLDVSPGGHLSGPGTGTSDSIDAKVSNKEFVVNAKDTANNLDLLHDINSGKVKEGRHVDGDQVHSPIPSDGTRFSAGGMAHFAEGGSADAAANNIIGNLKSSFADLGPGQHQITYDRNTGGATIDGVEYPRGSPILNDPQVKRAMEQSVAGSREPTKPKHKSDFVGLFGGHEFDTEGTYAKGGLVAAFAKGGLVAAFAKGGLVGSSSASNVARAHFAKGGRASSTAASFAERLSAMGLSTINIPHFAVGGMPDIPTPDLSKSTLKDANSNGIGGLHPVTLNLPAGGSVDGVYAKPDAVKQLRAAASSAKRFSTGPKPGWYGGTGR